QRRRDPGGDRRRRLGCRLGGGRGRRAAGPRGPRPGRRAAARDGAALRHQPRDACADRQLQIRPGACRRPAREAGAMSARLLFDPLLGWAPVAVLAAVALLAVALALWRGLPGWWLRALAALAL